jgi:membrane fusion protein (multidrug efflux system)
MNKKTVFLAGGVAAVSLAAGWFVHGLFGAKGGGIPPGARQMPAAAVTAVVVKESSLLPDDKYIAAVEPIEDVMIRSEVSGYIDAVHFTEGGMVKEGDLLFTIDRRTYQAAADAAEAEMNRTRKLYDRMKSADARSISASDLETAESNFLKAQADFRMAQVSLNYTEIKAPVSGRIGAAEATKGNYVTSASGALARIVQMDPVRVTFSLTDREYLRLRRQELAGAGGTRVAQVRLPGGTVLPTLGKKEFDDNAMNPQTGTIAVRYLFDNKDQMLVPGGYVTALLRNPDGEKGILIPQKALLVDQQGTYVLTVDENSTVAPARITAGKQIGTDITVLSGLKPGDRVIVDGVQKAQPGATVQVTLAEDK